MNEQSSPKIAVSIDQGTGEFTIVGNRAGLKDLNSSIGKIVEIDQGPEEVASCALDKNLTQDVSYIVMGETAVKQTIEMSNLYNAAAKEFNSAKSKTAFTTYAKYIFKSIWLWVLPIVGLISVIKLAANA